MVSKASPVPAASTSDPAALLASIRAAERDEEIRKDPSLATPETAGLYVYVGTVPRLAKIEIERRRTKFSDGPAIVVPAEAAYNPGAAILVSVGDRLPDAQFHRLATPDEAKDLIPIQTILAFAKADTSARAATALRIAADRDVDRKNGVVAEAARARDNAQAVAQVARNAEDAEADRLARFVESTGFAEERLRASLDSIAAQKADDAPARATTAGDVTPPPASFGGVRKATAVGGAR